MLKLTGTLHVTPFALSNWNQDQELYDLIKANEVLSKSPHDWVGVLEPDDETYHMVMNDDFQQEGTFLLEELRQFASCIQKVCADFAYLSVTVMSYPENIRQGFSVSSSSIEAFCDESFKSCHK